MQTPAHLGGVPEVVERIEGHLQQLVGLAQPVPGPVVLWVQINRPPVGLCTAAKRGHVLTEALASANFDCGCTCDAGMVTAAEFVLIAAKYVMQAW